MRAHAALQPLEVPQKALTCDKGTEDLPQHSKWQEGTHPSLRLQQILGYKQIFKDSRYVRARYGAELPKIRMKEDKGSSHTSEIFARHFLVPLSP